MTLTFSIPDTVCAIIQRLESHGYEAYAVGGCVPDPARLGSLHQRTAARDLYVFLGSSAYHRWRKAWDNCSAVGQRVI